MFVNTLLNPILKEKESQITENANTAALGVSTSDHLLYMKTLTVRDFTHIVDRLLIVSNTGLDKSSLINSRIESTYMCEPQQLKFMRG